MALLKNIKYPNGTESNYHRIHEISLMHSPYVKYVSTEDGVVKEYIDDNYTLNITVRSYVSRNIRMENEENYLEVRIIITNGTSAMVEGSNIMALGYQMVKEDPEFMYSEDV